MTRTATASHQAPTARRVMLVTGAHRSGTSVLGEILEHSEGVAQVWEPFNPVWGLRPVRDPYPFLPADGAPDARLLYLRRYLDSGLGLWSARPGSRRLPSPVLDLARTAQSRWRWQRTVRQASTVLVKDPFLLLALGGFVRDVAGAPPASGPGRGGEAQPEGEGAAHVVLTVRHPCSWVGSLARVGWSAGRVLASLLAQPGVRDAVADILPRWAEQGPSAARQEHRDPVTGGALLWAVLYRMVEHQLGSTRGVQVVAMERLAADPASELGRLFRRCALLPAVPLPELAERYTRAGTVQPRVGVVHDDRRRDSRRLAMLWTEQMTAADQDRVRTITEPVYRRFYPSWTDPMQAASG